MRILVCGSRNWTHRNDIDRLMAKFAHYQDEFGEKVVIVVGDARGADEIAAERARAHGLLVEMHYADWASHGKAAGPIRNLEMLDSGVRAVHAFRTDGISRGTDHTVAEARKRDIPVVLTTISERA